MDDLDRELSRLFDAARGTTEPTSADRRRIGAALAAKLATGVLLTSASANAAAAGGAAAGLAKGLKLVLLTQVGPALLAGSVLGGGASLLLSAATDAKTAPADTVVIPAQHTAEAPRSPRGSQAVTGLSPSQVSPRAAAAVSTARESTRPVASSLPVASSSPSGNGSAIAAFPAPAPQPETSKLGSELALVARMHAAWQRADWAGVRSAVQAHEQQFPRGTLSEEREAVKTMLACRAEPARALEHGSAFSSRHPASTHAARVSAVCGAKR